ncbi:type 4a pilus biogenesis protein PilO [bacterium]|nr:type 4a pilus biogenesis protein PilO [bacterium]
MKLILKFNPILWVFIIATVLYMDFTEWETTIYQPLLQQVEGERAALERLKGQLAEIEEFRSQKNEKIAEMAELRTKLQVAKKEFPSKPDLPALLKSLADISEKIGMEFSSFKPGGNLPAKEGLLTAKISVKLKGSYVQIMSFLDSVSNLTRIVNAEKIVLKPSTQADSSGFKSIDADMDIQTYYGGGS